VMSKGQQLEAFESIEVSAEQGDTPSELAVTSETETSTFWIVGYPGIETSLLVVPKTMQNNPSDVQGSPSGLYTADLEFFDSDGHSAGQAQVAFSVGSMGVLELSQFMAGFKLESGLKHGSMRVTVSSDTRCVCRFHTTRAAVIVGEPHEFSASKAAFFPVALADDRKSLVALVNNGGEPAVVRCRFYRGKRSPEASVTIPPNGSRVLGIEPEFSGHVEIGAGKLVQAYLRVSTRSEELLGVQMIEEVDDGQGGKIFTAVA